MQARIFTDPVRLYCDLIRATIGRRAYLASSLAEAWYESVIGWWAS